MPVPPRSGADFVRDTSPSALALFYEIQRRKSREQKLADVFELSEGLFETVKTEVRLRYPEAGEREIFLRAVAMGWDPAEHE